MKHWILPVSIGAGISVLVVVIIVLAVHLRNNQNTDYPSLKFTIVGTNDLHGKYYASLLSRSDNLQKYGYGGLQIMASIIEILKRENPRNFMYLDAGDQFQGAFESSKEISSGEIIADYFNHMKLASSAVGNHEFDFGQQFLRSYIQKLQNNILSANLIDSSYVQSESQRFPLYRQQPSSLFSYPISEDLRNQTIIKEVKIGVIGLATIETLYTTSGFTDKLFPSSYQFEKYTQIVVDQSNKLKQKGAHAIILVSHVGNQCGKDTTYGIWTPQNMGNFDGCTKDDEIFALIDTLPENTVDAVIQGHRHSTSHFFYKGIPILGNVNDGNYLNVLYLNFKDKQDALFVDKDSISIQGPIPICQKVFENTQKCEYVKTEDLQEAGALIDWDFHGVKVEKDKELAQLTNTKWAGIMQQYEIEIVPNFIPYPLEKIYTVKNPLGNLITNLLASYMKTKPYNFHFIMLNSGSFRSAWYPGIIRYAELRSMFPFDNKLSFFDIKGSDLKKLIQTVQSGKKAFYPSYGLSQIFQKSASNNSLSLINLVLADGSPIVDDQVYTGVTNDFLVAGGDDFKGQIGLLSNIVMKSELIRDIVRSELILLDSLTEQNIRNPTNLQRLIILN